jgi:hypothetical protein
MKTVSNEIIKQAILLKDGRTNKQIAMDLGVTSMRVSSNYSHLSNKGLVPKLGKVKVVKKTKKVKKVKVVVNTYNNTDGVKKQEARNIIEKAIIASKLFEKPILTLPFEECKLEMQLLKNVSENLRFLGCEMIDETYNKMLMTIASNNLPISTHKGKIGDIILEARENQFSNLILDYCGQFGTYQNDIKTAMENNIVEVNGSEVPIMDGSAGPFVFLLQSAVSNPF